MFSLQIYIYIFFISHRYSVRSLLPTLRLEKICLHINEVDFDCTILLTLQFKAARKKELWIGWCGSHLNNRINHKLLILDIKRIKHLHCNSLKQVLPDCIMGKIIIKTASLYSNWKHFFSAFGSNWSSICTRLLLFVIVSLFSVCVCVCSNALWSDCIFKPSCTGRQAACYTLRTSQID